MGYTAFDLEIKESPVDNGRTWVDAREGRCGVSVLCCYDSDLDSYLFFDDHNLDEGMEYLRNSDLLVSFNGAEFDVPCLEGYTGSQLGLVPHYDILRSVWQGLGKRRKGYKLTEICERTLGVGKTSTGEFATQLWDEGRHAELYTYCLKDVQLTSRLFDFIVEKGYIVDLDGNPLEVHNIAESEARSTTNQ